MKTLGVVLLASTAALLGCPPGNTWDSRVEEPEYMPPPPSHLFRKPADFRVRDVHAQKEYFLYFYEDEEVSEIVITVTNYALPEGTRAPRLAMLDEFDDAIALFQEMWVSLGQEDRLRYFNRRHSEEMSRNATLLDQQIRFKEAELTHLQTERHDLEADLKSRKDTNTFPEGNSDKVVSLPPTPALEREILRRDLAILLAKAQIDVLEYKRRLRNAEYARAGYAVVIRNTIRVGDLVPDVIPADAFIAGLRASVEPESWSRAEAKIEFLNGDLIVHQIRPVILKIREHIDAVRADLAGKARAKEKPSP